MNLIFYLFLFYFVYRFLLFLNALWIVWVTYHSISPLALVELSSLVVYQQYFSAFLKQIKGNSVDLWQEKMLIRWAVSLILNLIMNLKPMIFLILHTIIGWHRLQVIRAFHWFWEEQITISLKCWIQRKILLNGLNMRERTIHIKISK